MCVAYGPYSGAAVVRITSVHREGYNPSVGVESSDGYAEGWYESMFSSLDDITADWRPATEEETAKFESRFRPAPQNWD
ncbi:hypothetical protein ABT115_08790 [Streptomyces sp. NPDC001832]|uniref:hypothetical protein n=1 Tax=Streptomyces sp. NPDC001832 TaxID=3154527 RepID=UPI003321FE5E